MDQTKIRTAFVSTNSITQGEQVAGVWKPLYERFGIHIDFAYQTFKWASEAKDKAAVHCVIVGFSQAYNAKEKYLYADVMINQVTTINPYLVEAPVVFIENIKKPICNVPEMTTGNRPADGGHLLISDKDYDLFIEKEPKSKNYIKQFVGAAEFINNKKRWCLWLVNASPTEIRSMPLVKERVELCRIDRLNAPDAGRQKLAERPALFRETKNPKSYVSVPSTSSENRRYIPIGFLDDEYIPSNSTIILPDATIYDFGILTSNVHMAWMRTVAGRLKSDYRYSINIVYNNFIWPTPTDKQQDMIEKTAQEILNARALFPDSSFADLYDETVMPSALRKAHQLNDRAVMDAYGFDKKISESECVAKLMRLYQEKVTAVENKITK